MVTVAERTLQDVDVIVWLVEPSTFIGAGEQHIAEQLRKSNLPVILVINKTEYSKRRVIAVYRCIPQTSGFAEIIPASALHGDNTDTIIDMILNICRYGPMFNDEDTVTDQPERQIVAEIIREKALHALDEEIPHGIV